MVRFFVQLALLLFVFVYAWRRGRWPERVGASAMVADLAIDQVFHFAVRDVPDYGGMDPWHFGLDLALFAVFVAIGLRADRLWPLWLGSAQLLAVCGHLLRALDARMDPLVYAILDRWPFWLAILILAAGTWNSDRHIRAAAPSSSPKP